MLNHVENLNKLNDPKMIMEELKIIYKNLKDDLDYKELFSDSEKKSESSHVKKLLQDLDTLHGRLKFEVMYFTGNEFTPCHTHPEFVIDEVVCGELKEVALKPIEDSYKEAEETIRMSGDLKIINCPYGYPHKVIGVGDENYTLCLSLGNDGVQPICDKSIIS